MDHAPTTQELAVELNEARLSITALRAQLEGSAVTRLTDSLLDGFALFDPGAVVLEANPALCAMTGFTAEELIGTSPPHPCWPPESMDVFLAAMAEVLAGRIKPWELDLRCKDEGRVPVLVTPSLLRRDDGEVVSVTLMIKDLSERRRFEAALAESEELFRLTFDQAPVGAALTDNGYRFQRVNDAFCRMLGYTREELLALTFTDITHPDDVEVDVREVGRLGRGEIDRHVHEKRYVRKDGEVVWGRVVVRPVVNAAGRRIANLAMVDDVTERQRALDALRLSEQRLHSVLDAAHEGIILQARDGTVLTFNKAAGAVFGVAESDVVGESALGRDWETIHEDGSPWLPDDHPTMRAMQTGRPALGLPIGVVRDGETRWVLSNAYPIIPEGETEPVAAVVSFADQTERLKAERELRESEERNRLLLQNVNDAVFVHELKGAGPGRFIEVNDRACESLGYSRDELLAMDVSAIDTPEQQDLTPAIIAEVLKTGRSVFQTEHLAKDGRRIPVEVSARTFEMQGRPVVLSVARDITERQAAERALRDAEERFRDLFEQSPIPIWQEDFSAVRAWLDDHGDVRDWTAHFDDHPEDAEACSMVVRIVASNQAGLDFFGAGSMDELQRDLGSYFSEESRAAFRSELATLAGGGTRFSSEAPIVDPRTGEQLTLSLHLNVVHGHEDRLDRVLVSFVDVTEQQRAEAEIRRLNDELQRRVVSRTEQLDAATRELEALAYSIAHDVRAPLRTIDGFSAAVMEDELERLSPDGIVALRRVRNAAQTLARLLDDLMGLSHVSRRELIRRAVDLTGLAEEVGEETAADHPSRHVMLTVAPGLSADADPGLVRLILRELLGNAWKFTGPIADAHVEIGALDVDNERAFYVRDDGVGFDMRYAEHLFGIFQRMHPPGQYEGDGVGLATVQRLVRRHGGRTWAASQPGRGTTVYFTLPSDGPRAEEEAAGQAGGAG